MICLKNLLSYLFLLAFTGFFAQDRVYFLTGKSKDGKVLEITSSQVIIKTYEDTETLVRSEILLIRFNNGVVEMMTAPAANVVYNPSSKIKLPDNLDGKIHSGNISLNTLALCNADISVFYEYLTPSRSIGLGLMGAYNFNLYATTPNLFIAMLPNAKKNFDLGATFNFYPGKFANRTTLFMGVMIKYTNFNFDYSLDTSKTIVNYKPGKGNQLAALFTLGTHTLLKDHFFLKTIGGLGIFRLNGNYRDQFNFEINKNSQAKPAHVTFLPKLYFGINIGFNF